MSTVRNDEEQVKMEIVGIGSTTHRDNHGHKMAKEDLEDLASRYTSVGAVKLTEEHDLTLPPLGQWREGRVEPMEDGEYKLVIVGEVYEKEEKITLPDGTDAIIRESKTDNRPFGTFGPYQEAQPTEPVISYDRNNFENRNAINKFLKEIEDSSNLEFITGDIIRKAVISDPQLIISVGNAIWTAINTSIILKKTGAKLSEEVSDDILNFYRFIKTSVIGMTKYAVPKNRPITYVFVLPTTPSIQLVARTKDAETITAAFYPDCIEHVSKTIEQYQRMFEIREAQFILSDKGDWNFNYLLTGNGQVIGRMKSFRRKVHEIDMAQFQNMGLSLSLIGNYSVPQRHNSKGENNKEETP